MLRSAMVDEILDALPLTCTICGRPLGIFPEDQPDWPTGPICGDCYQAQQMDDEIWMTELDEEA